MVPCTCTGGRGFSLAVPESVPLYELKPTPSDVAAVVQGFLGVAEHFGEEEVVVLEAILVHKLGLFDASVLFPKVRLVDRIELFAVVLLGSWGTSAISSDGRAVSSSGGSLISSRMSEMRRGLNCELGLRRVEHVQGSPNSSHPRSSTTLSRLSIS